MKNFRAELENLLNRNSAENGSDTPDFILANYLESCLDAFDEATNRRDSFYNFETKKQPLKDLGASSAFLRIE